MKIIQDIMRDPKKYLKYLGLGILVLIVLSLGTEFLGNNEFSRISNKSSLGGLQLGAPSFDDGEYFEQSVADATISTRNINHYDPAPAIGVDAEDFEFTSYNLSYEKSDIKDTCQQVLDLKQREDIIFSSANNYDHGCNYEFKVKNDIRDEVLYILHQLDPEDISENTRTIKQQLDDFTSEEDILKAKITRIDETLDSAVKAYDEISTLATSTQDVETLSTIINNKINIIERLTEQKILVNSQLDRLSRSKAEQVDRLDFTTFSVSVSQRKYIDGERIKDSWRLTIQQAVRSINSIVQALSINMLVLLFLIGQYIIYALIAVYLIKYGWLMVKSIWNK